MAQAIWIIERSWNSGEWKIQQCHGFYKNPHRAKDKAAALQLWHRTQLNPDNPNFGNHFRATRFVPDVL